MKRIGSIALIAVMCMMLIGMVATPASAYATNGAHPHLHWLWEGRHATMINAMLLTANDCLVKNNEVFVELAKEYSERDPLIRVYGLRERYDDDSEKDAFLVGLKANNLIYLIHVADDNPMARKLAIKELRLLGKNVHNNVVKREFPYWADLLEEGRYPSKRLSHVYVHHTIDIGNYYADRLDINKRFLYWLGYLINDFTIANLCKNEEWIQADQGYLEKLYSIRIFGHLSRSVTYEWDRANVENLELKAAIDRTQKRLDYIKKTWTDRQMGNKKTMK